MTGSLPRKCFISHSYRDAENKQLLLRALPPHVDPFFFPSITVTPDEMVSKDLIVSTLDSEGLVYLE